jgi:hypothetical protein
LARHPQRVTGGIDACVENAMKVVLRPGIVPTSVGLAFLLFFQPTGSGQEKDQVSRKPIGVQGPVGCRDNPKKVDRLIITRPGVYDNYLVDSAWQGGNRVKISADNVTLRNCEIRNATGNGVGAFGKNVTIENCKIHHLLNSNFKDQKDAHGVTGGWNNLTVRNCEIYYVSGDSVQIDPDRRTRGHVLIEDCAFWTGPLPEDAGAFKKGERPGENGVDTKTIPMGDTSTMVIRNCYFYGWKQPGQIGNMAALNLKENVDVTVENCLFRDNEIAFRLRGPTKGSGARVRISDCAIYEGNVGVRMENQIKDLRIHRLGFGTGVRTKYDAAGGGAGAGYENTGEHQAPAFEELLKKGFAGNGTDLTRNTFAIQEFELWRGGP